MTNANSVGTLIETSWQSNDFSKKITNVPYREAAGKLIFLKVPRSDVSFAASIVSRYLEDRSGGH